MHSAYRRVAVAAVFATGALISGCGGGGGGSTSTTTPFSASVIDGAIFNALVCLDKNRNGQCDSSEPQGRTNAQGQVTFNIANADLGKYPVLAVVGTDATDTDTGPVTTAFTMTAPADQPAVVSPLTTLVQQLVTSTGASTASAAASVQSSLGLDVSPLQNYVLAGVPSSGTNPGVMARMVVVTTQQQQLAISSSVGTSAADGSTITQVMVDQAIQKKVLELLPDLITAVSSPSVAGAANNTAKEAALLSQASTLISQSGLTTAAMPTVVAVNNQTNTPSPVVAPTPVASFSLVGFSFTDASNFYARLFAATAAQATPDASNNVKYMDRRYSSVSGNLARWSTHNSPRNQGQLSWDGSAWSACALDFENTASLRDANGNNTYSYCNRETGRSNRATFDVSGQSMLTVYNAAVAAGYTNLYVTNAASVLGSAVFPSGSSQYLQTGTSLTTAFTYYPDSSHVPNSGEVVGQWSTVVTAGGTASSNGSTGCNSADWNTDGTNTHTLEEMIAAKPGVPCTFSPGSFTYNGNTYSTGSRNELWGRGTISLGTLGTVPLNTGTAPGYYSGNTKFRVAFDGGSSNSVRYYACQERFTDGGTRNCNPIGTPGTYTITTLGDARVMTFNNLPAQMAPLTWTTALIERNGLVYYGYKDKLSVTKTARFNEVAATALLSQLGISLPSSPMDPIQLTAASYRGVYEVYDPAGATPGAGTIVKLYANLSATCEDALTGSINACTVTVTNPSTGAFTVVNGGTTSSGTVNFMTGSGSGTFTAGASGSFVIHRR